MEELRNHILGFTDRRKMIDALLKLPSLTKEEMASWTEHHDQAILEKLTAGESILFVLI